MKVIDLDAVAEADPKRGTDAKRLAVLRKIYEALTAESKFIINDMAREYARKN